MSKGITIVGLGPGEPDLLTMEAWQVLQSAHEIYLQTRKHPIVEALPSSIVIHSFDDLREHPGALEVDKEIASHILGLGTREEGVIYAVSGHPFFGDASVPPILTLAEEHDLPIRVVEGLSRVEPLCTRLRLDPQDGLQLTDATNLARRHYPEFSPDVPLLIGQLSGRDVAAEVKSVLVMVYPDDHSVTLVAAAGTPAMSLCVMPLCELDRCEGTDNLTWLYVPRILGPSSPAAFQEVVARLRGPDGCPWDREQTHRSLRPYLLEEAHEVLSALDNENLMSLREELGDLLLQVLLHTQIAIEQREFRMSDVVSYVVAKLKRRHPHVFGDVHVANSDEVLANWEQIKRLEGGHQRRQGILEGIPDSMPALARAQAVQRRAARVGFDWPDAHGVWAKVEEEQEELREATPGAAQEAELGDLLFSLVNLARWLHADAECALREATARFEQRFREMEQRCAAQGCQLADLDASELDELWNQAKEQDG
jgi:tetrapyrrole methylase family protein/MazG family protein